MNFNPWKDYFKSSEVFFKDWNMNNRSVPEIEQQQNDSIVLQLNQILSIITEDSMYFLNLKKELLNVERENGTSFPEIEFYENSLQQQNVVGTESSIGDKDVSSFDKEEKQEKDQKTRLPCSFCRKNGERKLFYMSHSLKNSEGLVMCPVLQKYVCPKCKATGPKAHTLLYCPQKNNQYHSTSLTHSTPRMSSGKKRHAHHC